MHKAKTVASLVFALVLLSGGLAASVAGATVTISIEGMHCGGCATSVQKKLQATDGVEEVRVSFEKKEAWIKFDDKKITLARLREVINSTGFKAVGEKSAE